MYLHVCVTLSTFSWYCTSTWVRFICSSYYYFRSNTLHIQYKNTSVLIMILYSHINVLLLLLFQVHLADTVLQLEYDCECRYLIWSISSRLFGPSVCLPQGEVVALERIRNKIDRIRQNAQMLHLRSIKVYCFNSTRAVSSGPRQGAEGTHINI